jgi:ribosomal protein L25 (general stress protein Ctc)
MKGDNDEKKRENDERKSKSKKRRRGEMIKILYGKQEERCWSCTNKTKTNK